MFLAFFHLAERLVFRGQRGRGDRFGHTSGGSVSYVGLRTSPDKPPAHLLFRLDTADPCVGVRLSTSQWLPLLCPIRYGGCAMGYRVISDTEVRILRMGEAEALEGFPRDDYPEELPVESLRVVPGDYDPSDTGDVWFYAGVFGYDHLTPLQYAQMVRDIDESGAWDDGTAANAEEYARDNELPYVQGRPQTECPDPACANHSRPASLRTIAVFEEHAELADEMWGPDCGVPQVIWQVCPLCEAIAVENQAT